MTYYTKEAQDAAAMNKIKEYNIAAGLFPVIREVCQKFDGKVYNKRFPEALEKATGIHVYADNRPWCIDLYFYGNNYNGEYTLLRLVKENMIDGKRIDAETAIKDAAERRANYLKKASDLRQVMEHSEELKAQIKQLTETLDAIVKSIPYDAQDIYGLYARVTTR